MAGETRDRQACTEIDGRMAPAVVSNLRRLFFAFACVAGPTWADTAYFNWQTPIPNPSGSQTVFRLMMRSPELSVMALDLRLSYAPTSAPLAAVSIGPLMAGMVGVVNTNEAGTVRIGLAGASPVGGEGIVAALTFDTTSQVAVSAALAMVNEGGIASVMVTNTAPEISGPAQQTVEEGNRLIFTNDVRDSDVPTNQMDVRLVSGPPGLSTASDGTIDWTPTELQGPSTNMVVVQVADNGVPPLIGMVTNLVIVTEVNTAPELTAIGDRTVAEGEELRVAVSATDGDVPVQTLTYSLEAGAPAGAAIGSDGVFTWTPGEGQGPSTNTITIRVSDGLASDTETITVIVTAPKELRILAAVRVIGDQLELRWSGDAGAVYDVLFRDEMNGGVWIWLRRITNSTDSTVSFTDSMGSRRQVFYRLERVLKGPGP